MQHVNAPSGSGTESASATKQHHGCGSFFKGKKNRHTQTNTHIRHFPSHSPGTVPVNLQRHSSATDTSTSSSNTSSSNSGSRSNLTDCCLGRDGTVATALCERQAQPQLCLTQQTRLDNKAQVSCSPHVSLGRVTPQQQQPDECDAAMLQHADAAKLPKHSHECSQKDGDQAGLHVLQVGGNASDLATALPGFCSNMMCHIAMANSLQCPVDIESWGGGTHQNG